MGSPAHGDTSRQPPAAAGNDHHVEPEHVDAPAVNHEAKAFGTTNTDHPPSPNPTCVPAASSQVLTTPPVPPGGANANALPATPKVLQGFWPLDAWKAVTPHHRQKMLGSEQHLHQNANKGAREVFKSGLDLRVQTSEEDNDAKARELRKAEQQRAELEDNMRILQEQHQPLQA